MEQTFTKDTLSFNWGMLMYIYLEREILVLEKMHSQVTSPHLRWDPLGKTSRQLWESFPALGSVHGANVLERCCYKKTLGLTFLTWLFHCCGRIVAAKSDCASSSVCNQRRNLGVIARVIATRGWIGSRQEAKEDKQTSSRAASCPIFPPPSLFWTIGSPHWQTNTNTDKQTKKEQQSHYFSDLGKTSIMHSQQRFSLGKYSETNQEWVNPLPRAMPKNKHFFPVDGFPYTGNLTNKFHSDGSCQLTILCNNSNVTNSSDELTFVKRRAKDGRFFSKHIGIRQAKFRFVWIFCYFVN